jgi:hypothetical protein
MNLSGRNLLAVAALAPATAIALSACGGSGTAGSAGAGANPRAEISRAADTSSAAQGYTVRMSLHESVPGAGTVVVDVSGAISAPTRSGTMTETIEASGQSESIQEIVRGPIVYMKLPGSTAAAFGTDRPWIKLDYRQFSKTSYLSSVAALSNSASESDPAQSFTYLRSETRHLVNFGPATVAGVETTHYGAIANLRKAGAGAPASTRAAIRRVLRDLPGTIVDETAVPIDVWVDGSHYVRKLRLEMQLIPKGSTQLVDATELMVFTGYGPQPVPSAPPADQTANLLSLLKARGESSSALSGS